MVSAVFTGCDCYRTSGAQAFTRPNVIQSKESSPLSYLSTIPNQEFRNPHIILIYPQGFLGAPSLRKSNIPYMHPRNFQLGAGRRGPPKPGAERKAGEPVSSQGNQDRCLGRWVDTEISYISPSSRNLWHYGSIVYKP